MRRKRGDLYTLSITLPQGNGNQERHFSGQNIRVRILMEFICLPVITRMLTSKKGALLKEIIELDHNYTLTSESE